MLMEQTDVIAILRDAIYTLLLTSAPMIITALVVGLIISIIQATTQIHEQTLAFVPKIVAVFLMLLAFAGFIITSLNDFTYRMFDYIRQILVR